MGSRIGSYKSAARIAGCTLEEYINKKENGEKWCYNCHNWKTLSMFWAHSSRSDGKDPVCSECRITWKPKNGRKHSPAAIIKMSKSKIGKLGGRLGRKHSDEAIKKMKNVRKQTKNRGPLHYNWKGGITDEIVRIRASTEYKDWRTSVFKRDNYTCQICGDAKGGNLHAHHIKQFAHYPELRLDVDNGQTVCKDCHENIHAKNKEKI
jgi:hypothetical protein